MVAAAGKVLRELGETLLEKGYPQLDSLESRLSSRGRGHTSQAFYIFCVRNLQEFVMFSVNGFYKDATAASKLVQVLAETFPQLSETSDYIPHDAAMPYCFLP